MGSRLEVVPGKEVSTKVKDSAFNAGKYLVTIAPKVDSRNISPLEPPKCNIIQGSIQSSGRGGGGSPGIFPSKAHVLLPLHKDIVVIKRERKIMLFCLFCTSFILSYKFSSPLQKLYQSLK